MMHGSIDENENCPLQNRWHLHALSTNFAKQGVGAGACQTVITITRLYQSGNFATSVINWQKNRLRMQNSAKLFVTGR
jgi:hypothetical protein